mmetsp:Transcript_8915/g.21933  ORF Transcript_8915/g.21933 Transcript_8915/m.21933 type:complete len:159 (+) Transcript_8915:259-735(+)
MFAQQTCEMQVVQHEVDVKDLINHVGAHILIETREEWKVRYAKLKPRRPCGVCGVNEVCGRKPTESIPYCAVWLTKRNASLRAHACKNFDVPQYSYRWAAKVSKRSPCTNVPIICSSWKQNEEQRSNINFHIQVQHARTHQKHARGQMRSGGIEHLAR